MNWFDKSAFARERIASGSMGLRKKSDGLKFNGQCKATELRAEPACSYRPSYPLIFRSPLFSMMAIAKTSTAIQRTKATMLKGPIENHVSDSGLMQCVLFDHLFGAGAGGRIGS